MGRAGSSLGEVIFLPQASQATLRETSPRAGLHTWGTTAAEPSRLVDFDRRWEQGEGKVSALGHRTWADHLCKLRPATTTQGKDLDRIAGLPPRPTPAHGNLSDSESCVQGWRFASGSRDSSRIKLRPHCDALLHLDHLLLVRELFREIARRTK